VWNPKAYTGTYTGNSFKLTFEDNSSNTATTLGKDTSGNSNNWTPNNLSVTAGAGNDSLVDVPTNGAQTDTGVGGEVRGNYAVLNPLSKQANCTLSNGNLDWAATSTSSVIAQSTIAMSSGKWYCEFTATSSDNMFGLQRAAGTVATTFIGGNADSWGYYGGNGNKYTNNSATSYGASYTTNDVIGVAFDADNGTLTFYKNGASQGQAYSGLTSGPYTFALGNGGTVSAVFNAGARSFAYTAPSGFKALCSSNLPAPLITKPSDLFDIALWTGNGGTQTVSLANTSITPDFIWFKSRSIAMNNHVVDVVRGTDSNGYLVMQTDATFGESVFDTSWHNTYGKLTSISGNSFTVVSGSSNGGFNTNNVTYAGWCWDAGSSTVTNTQGSITSSVRANATAGFSIVTYTGNGTSGATVGHGLGVAPAMIIVKNRTATAGYLNWGVYHASLGATKAIYLNTTGAESSDANVWNNTAPSSTVFSLGFSSGNGYNISGQSYVAYCFAPQVGYSSFGSWTGSGNSNGSFIYTGFAPRWILARRTDVAENWVIWDSARETYNPRDDVLWPHSSQAEITGDGYARVDFLSNGFKFRNASFPGLDGSGATYIYAAFAESPFNYARAR
jgi:hypothetical protein